MRPVNRCLQGIFYLQHVWQQNYKTGTQHICDGANSQPTPPPTTLPPTWKHVDVASTLVPVLLIIPLHRHVHPITSEAQEVPELLGGQQPQLSSQAPATPSNRAPIFYLMTIEISTWNPLIWDTLGPCLFVYSLSLPLDSGGLWWGKCNLFEAICDCTIHLVLMRHLQRRKWCSKILNKQNIGCSFEFKPGMDVTNYLTWQSLASQCQ